MTADEYDTGEASSPTARSGAVGGGTEAAIRDGRIGASTDESPRTVAATSPPDTEERLYV